MGRAGKFLGSAIVRLGLWPALLVAWFCFDAYAFDDADRALYTAAVNYCRTRPAQKIFDDVTHIVCFDGQIFVNEDSSYIERLPEHGLFVVRSPGGRSGAAAKIAKVLAAKHADVVIYDYCLSACANVFLVASDRTYIKKDSIVAWHYGLIDDDTCGRVERDHSLTRTQCSTGRSIAQPLLFADAFLPKLVAARDRRILKPPMSAYVSRILIGYFEGTGVFRDVFWTWHPRFSKPLLRTEIEYEAYPESQDELDELAKRLLGAWRRIRIIYDP